MGSQGLVLLCLVLSSVDGGADSIVGSAKFMIFMSSPIPHEQGEGRPTCH